jgi:hypothetical protein
MFKQTRMCVFAAFVGGMVVGVAGLIFLGGGKDQVVPAVQAAEQKAPLPIERVDFGQIGRYQSFKFDAPNSYAALIDTVTGKVWALQGFATEPKWRWIFLTDGPK